MTFTERIIGLVSSNRKLILDFGTPLEEKIDEKLSTHQNSNFVHSQKHTQPYSKALLGSVMVM